MSKSSKKDASGPRGETGTKIEKKPRSNKKVPSSIKRGSTHKKIALSPKEEHTVQESSSSYMTTGHEIDPLQGKGLGIGEMAETSLHATLKHRLAKPGDRVECKVEGKIVDLLRANGEIVEVQTGNFGKLRDKIERFAPRYTVRVIYPIPARRTIVQIDQVSGEEVSRRKSPKRGSIYSIFEELIHFPELLSYPGVSLEILLVDVEELRVKDGKGSWRRRFQSILDKRLSGNEISHIFSSPRDLLELLPQELRPGFTTSDLAAKAEISAHLARKMAYVMKKTGVIQSDGKRGREILYSAPKAQKRAKRGEKAGGAGP